MASDEDYTESRHLLTSSNHHNSPTPTATTGKEADLEAQEDPLMARSRSNSTSTSSALKDLFTSHFDPPFSPSPPQFQAPPSRPRSRSRTLFRIDQLHVSSSSSSSSSPTSNSTSVYTLYTWHRILLIPVTGGVIVGMMHGLVEILDQIKQASSSHGRGFDLLSGVFLTIKAIQAAVALGTGCSLGPEGPRVDIGKSCANGFSVMMENNRERKSALVAAGAVAGISSGFHAAVAGCFFAIETVLRPLRAENSPPFMTAMIILASVISSTVSNISTCI